MDHMFSDAGSEIGDVKPEDEEAENDSSELDLDDDELENLLDENLPDDFKGSKQPKYEERFKTVLEEKGHNHFEVLPEGWVQVTHNSGMSLFLHKQSRVCSASRPYFLGAGSVRKHAIPLGAIPCLNYQRALEEEQKEKPTDSPIDVDIVPEVRENGEVNGEIKCPFAATNNDVENHATTVEDVIPNGTADIKNLVPAAKIVTVNENTQLQSLTPQQVNDYCKKLFKFKVIRVLRFRSWNARRKFTRNRKHIKNIQRPTLPDGTKLIKFPILAPTGSDANSNPRGRKEWIMNPNGKS